MGSSLGVLPASGELFLKTASVNEQWVAMVLYSVLFSCCNGAPKPIQKQVVPSGTCLGVPISDPLQLGGKWHQIREDSEMRAKHLQSKHQKSQRTRCLACSSLAQALLELARRTYKRAKQTTMLQNTLGLGKRHKHIVNAFKGLKMPMILPMKHTHSRHH